MPFCPFHLANTVSNKTANCQQSDEVMRKLDDQLLNTKYLHIDQLIDLSEYEKNVLKYN